MEKFRSERPAPRLDALTPIGRETPHAEERLAVPPDSTVASTPHDLPANRLDSFAAVGEKLPITLTRTIPPGFSAWFVSGLLVKLVILLPIAVEIKHFQNC